ncbi:zf-HC2 domain-containing protein [Phaeacidiphilus oryzae]|uniref:zf-HC2 domain-containing protein n=1 Tax=Phaeacidiphilus oryzae TaxID=348818 RepID=UPI000691641C|nr:zf-HC2 domain-containing protein [Phaeacidiphilus oryzae]
MRFRGRGLPGRGAGSDSGRTGGGAGGAEGAGGVTGAGGPGSGARPSAGDEHEELRSLLGAWALDACPPAETARLEAHLAYCQTCAEEARRLRDAAGWLSADDPLDPAPALRNRVLDGCLGLRDPAVRVPGWAAPFAAETAKLDALLKDLESAEWQERAEAPWQGGSLILRPAELLCHLAAVDGCAAKVLGLPDPVEEAEGGPGPGTVMRGPDGPIGGDPLMERTRRLIQHWRERSPEGVRALWREQTRALVEAAGRAGDPPEGPEAPPAREAPEVDYGRFRLPLADAFLDRAFECWIHGEDIARAVDYPYPPPSSAHLQRLVDLGARLLPSVLPAWLGPIRLVLEGAGGGIWTIGEEEPGEEPVADVVLDALEFCYLAAGRRHADRLPCGIRGDEEAAQALLAAVPRLSRP